MPEVARTVYKSVMERMGMRSSVSGGIGRWAVHVGMLCAALAFASWWTTHTILDTTRTRRVTDAVLDNANLRDFVATKIASATSPAVGAAAGPSQAVLTQRLDQVLNRPDIRAKLEQFVVDAHDNLIGKSSKPAVLDQKTTQTLVAAAVPNLTLKDLAKIHAVTFKVPNSSALSASRRTLANRFWLYFLAAIVLVGFALATSNDRRGTVKIVGAWLIAISVAHLIVLWVVPVMILPHVTSNPWAGLVAGVARALTAGLVTGLLVLAGAGVVCLFADRFIAPARTPAVAS